MTRRRALTLGMIRRLAAGLRIPTDVLIQPYPLPSNRDLQHLILFRYLDFLYINRQASLNRFVDIFKKLFKGVSLGDTARDRGYFCPIATFLGLVDDHLQLQAFTSIKISALAFDPLLHGK